MHLTSTDYYRDAIAWALLDEVDPQTIWQANLIAETGAEFNAAIEAAIRLQEITDAPDETHQPEGVRRCLK